MSAGGGPAGRDATATGGAPAPGKARVDELLRDTVTALEGKDIDAAEAAAEEATAIAEGLGADHCSDLAMCLCAQAKVHEHRPDGKGRAEELLLRAVNLAARHFGAEHRCTAECLCDLAALRCVRDDYAGARPAIKRLIAAIPKPGPAEYAGITVNATVLVRRCIQEKDLDLAQALAERTHEICEAAFEEGGIIAKLVVMLLCEVYVRQGDMSRADPLLQQLMGLGLAPHDLGIAGAVEPPSGGSSPPPAGSAPRATRRSRRKKKKR